MSGPEAAGACGRFSFEAPWLRRFACLFLMGMPGLARAEEPVQRKLGRRAAGEELAAAARAAAESLPARVVIPARRAPVPPSAALAPAKMGPPAKSALHPKRLPAAGRPGDVRLVTVSTDFPAKYREIIPPLPFRPFSSWREFLLEHRDSSHASLDWMDEHGQWWHTELRPRGRFAPEYLVGGGTYVGVGLRIYGIYLVPGRTDPETSEVWVDEKVACDHRLMLAEILRYGRWDRWYGDEETYGDGSENTGLGGPVFTFDVNCNTFIAHLLRAAGVDLPPPLGAHGWASVPAFPHSTRPPD